MKAGHGITNDLLTAEYDETFQEVHSCPPPDTDLAWRTLRVEFEETLEVIVGIRFGGNC